MAEPSPEPKGEPQPSPVAAASPTAARPQPELGSATYEIIRQRLGAQAAALQERMARLNARRQEVFGAVESKLLQAHRITTAHNCLPRDMVQLGRGRFLFGFNVRFGLKKEIDLGDVFAIYERDQGTGEFKETALTVLQDKTFLTDFKRLYNVYEKTVFAKFSLIENSLFMVFQIGASFSDLAVFKWTFNGGQLRYVDGRSEGEFRKGGFPPTHQFRWRTPDRESFRYGDHPHLSIENRVFVECIEGDLTIKVEDNTATGEGIYAEPVEDRNQKVDDAEIAYSILEHLILLKVRPYKENASRYFIFNEKQQSVVRVDSIGQSCALLPEDHGLIFPDGYYLATGDLKQFESREQGLVLDRVWHAPNGEDSLYIFYEHVSGQYVLMPYRLTTQKVEERMVCHGFSLFADGNLLLFRADLEPQKHHTIQLRQTPFYQPGFEPAGQKEAFLYQVGNKEVVRCLAEGNELLTLLRKEHPYAELYADVVKRCVAVLDAYPWLASADGFGINETLREIRATADQAVEEFDKVRRRQREAAQRMAELRKRCEMQFQALRRASFRTLDDFVKNLTNLRQLRGELITLKDLPYADVAQIAEAEKAVIAATDELSKSCVKFLLQPAALDPYRQQAAAQLSGVEKVTRAAEGKKLEQAVSSQGAELEMLIEIMNGLQIEDATEATRIIDSITAVYATLNQVKAALKTRLQHLAATEGAAQFSARMKLLSQSAASYLDLCGTPAKCDDYLNRITVQLEELEGAFADFEEYTVQIADKRTAIYEAFEQRKLALVEQRNRKTAALLTAAERILKVVQNRLGQAKSIEEINTCMASDLMIAKVRDLVGQLREFEDTVKADDLEGRLKSLQQEAVRQFKDRQELFAGGADLIQLGKHRFHINTQPLDLTIVLRDGNPHLHLTSTKFFENIHDEALLATREVWEQETASENREVYRGEYLAWQFLRASEAQGPTGLAQVLALSEEERLARLQEFMGARYQDGYTKGVHDLDAALIFQALAKAHVGLQLARYHPVARACAVVYWTRFSPPEVRSLWQAKLKGFSSRNRFFPGDAMQREYLSGLQSLLAGFVQQTGLFPAEVTPAAGEYLFAERTSGDTFAVSHEASGLVAAFRQHLVVKGCEDDFQQARQALSEHPASELQLVRDWARGFLLDRPASNIYLEEVAAVLFCGDAMAQAVTPSAASQKLEGLRGAHPLIREGRYEFEYLGFRARLEKFEREVAPQYEKYHRVKQNVLERERARLRLEEFKPRVLTSFVRNQLIDEVYLPLVGDNLAKQIGAAGAAKRTDLMGLLLLISPPGYGKTTLVEYVASRLGLVFMKINGPALGHAVTSLDPEEAPNAAAREEVHKLNLAFEMGDNVMVCLDDIQHTNPEFLQKFISLCDGQRKIEGVWGGKPRTHDLRGRKVVVVMAGNPYTESGQKFKIPDMLANRADTYNLGDVIGSNADWFEASYLENAVTSNAVLAPLANKSQKDIRAFIRMAKHGTQGEASFEASYSQPEVEEILSVMKKLVAIRDVVLKVNFEYISSAAQSDEFRTEPPFRLQGSYRNMNRLAEKVVPIMNETELQALILDHYEGEAQTLTTGAEANLLKFKELIGRQSEEEAARWRDIKQTFQRNQASRGADASDPVGRLVVQLAGFQQGLQGIQGTLEKQLTRAAEAAATASKQAVPAAPMAVDLAPIGKAIEALRTTLERTPTPAPPPIAPVPMDASPVAVQLGEGLKALRDDLSRAITAVHKGTMADKVDSLSHELEMIHSTMATLKDLAAQQRDHLRNAQDLLATRAKQGTVEIDLTQEMLTNERAFLERFQEVLAKAQTSEPPSHT